MTVYFIGAGPGDPDLITVKGLKLIQQADLILYAGSLVPTAVLQDAKDSATLINTAELHLDQIIEYIQQAEQQGQLVARVHSGDPSLYGAIGEQIRRLKGLGIDFEVVPGVTATAASAAALGQELTLSGVSQTVILTRFAGKTPMPEQEQLSQLAKSKATLAIHLSITKLGKITEELIPHYGKACPVAVCYRVSWPDQQIIKGTLSDITEKVRAKDIKLTALILVGHVLDSEDFFDSHLYDKAQPNLFRKPA